MSPFIIVNRKFCISNTELVILVYAHSCVQLFLATYIYNVSSNKHAEGAYVVSKLSDALFVGWCLIKRARHLFQSRRNNSYEISKLCNFRFSNNNKSLPLGYICLNIPELLVTFIFYSLYTSSMCILI